MVPGCVCEYHQQSITSKLAAPRQRALHERKRQRKPSVDMHRFSPNTEHVTFVGYLGELKDDVVRAWFAQLEILC
jgi:hypothetical protein